MAYQTGGAGGDITALMDGLRAFALGLGWTIDLWDNPNRLLFMHKGLCTVTMSGVIGQTVQVYSGANNSGISTFEPDNRLYFAMGTANDPALTTFYSHPGSPVTSGFDGDAPFLNGLTGPFIGWFFFADPTVSDHIHCVVQISAEVYKHFSLGHVDKRGMTHSGVAYVHACPTTHWRNVSGYISSGDGAFNDPGQQHYPFVVCNQGPNVPSAAASYDESPALILKHANAWPAGWQGPVASASGSGTLRGLALPMFRPVRTGPAEWPATGGKPRLLDLVLQAEPAPYSNVVPLMPIPCFRNHIDTGNANSRRICYVGDFPNVRFCNMTNLIPGQELTYGTDTYKVFPCLRQSLWTDSRVDPMPQSGQLAIAYKKVA